MKTIAHGRYAPALPRLVEHLWHRDPRMRRAAHDALLAWGHDAVSELRRAQSRARPDRRQAIGQVLEAIESTERPD
ncbi:MAG: hypothetical protein H6730_34055 [Deltaproteobacteria bacterium]|nr:hypothetical protein [Deltaproteobacteria bacterium]